ncbi:MAG: DUF5988 family protein [Pseudonocardia sp.]|nr:DUF5988 family protein [Pseudonocardia sp.]
MNLDGGTAWSHGEPVEVVLEGGPLGIPRSMSTPAGAEIDRIKIQHLNGYEHFELDPTTADSVPLHFCWTMRTRIAE